MLKLHDYQTPREQKNQEAPLFYAHATYVDESQVEYHFHAGDFRTVEDAEQAIPKAIEPDLLKDQTLLRHVFKATWVEQAKCRT